MEEEEVLQRPRGRTGLGWRHPPQNPPEDTTAPFPPPHGMFTQEEREAMTAARRAATPARPAATSSANPPPPPRKKMLSVCFELAHLQKTWFQQGGVVRTPCYVQHALNADIHTQHQPAEHQCRSPQHMPGAVQHKTFNSLVTLPINR